MAVRKKTRAAETFVARTTNCVVEGPSMKKWIRSVATLGVMSSAIVLAARSATASTISIGTTIPITADTFAVPIDIADGVDVTAWQFDLAYDATNVNVNTGCDPFTDPYCSLITGAVTEGAYFASGDPFNLLNPGFVRLDPISFAQDGLLFAVNGAFGGTLPGPSGDGVLAFVEFTTIGSGLPSITLENSSTTEAAPVPEPASLLLLGPALLLVRRLQFRSLVKEDR